MNTVFSLICKTPFLSVSPDPIGIAWSSTITVTLIVALSIGLPELSNKLMVTFWADSFPSYMVTLLTVIPGLMLIAVRLVMCL